MTASSLISAPSGFHIQIHGSFVVPAVSCPLSMHGLCAITTSSMQALGARDILVVTPCLSGLDDLF
jgi:hypothetical protein